MVKEENEALEEAKAKALEEAKAKAVKEVPVTGVLNPQMAKEAGLNIFGDPDTWKLLSKAHNSKMMKSTKVLNVATGCLVQVSTMYLNDDGTKSLAEALEFVPGCHFAEKDGVPRIVSIAEAKA